MLLVLLVGTGFDAGGGGGAFLTEGARAGLGSDSAGLASWSLRGSMGSDSDGRALTGVEDASASG